MPRDDTSKYTEKQKRQAEHIEEGYEDRGVSQDEAGRRVWATVNKIYGSSERRSSGSHIPNRNYVYEKAGHEGGTANAERSAKDRSLSAKKIIETRKRKRR